MTHPLGRFQPCATPCCEDSTSGCSECISDAAEYEVTLANIGAVDGTYILQRCLFNGCIWAIQTVSGYVIQLGASGTFGATWLSVFGGTSACSLLSGGGLKGYVDFTPANCRVSSFSLTTRTLGAWTGGGGTVTNLSTAVVTAL